MNDVIERVERAIGTVRRGEMVILVDDEDRENEGDLVFAAEKVTADHVNFMAREGRGLICLTLTEGAVEQLQLPMMVADNRASLGTAFTVSVEARCGVTTGISAKDRATTIAAAVADGAHASDLVSPGHVFPLRARKGGVLVRTGQTEGSVDLARLAGLKPAGVICEIIRDDGEMARMPDLEVFAKKHDIPIVSVADLISYRLEREKIVGTVGESGQLRPPALGPGEPFTTHLYCTDVEDTEYLALVRGDVRAAAEAGDAVLVRVQSMSPVGDVFMSRPGMVEALQAIDAAGVGVFLYVFNKNRTSLRRSYEREIMQQKGPPSPTRVQEKSEALRDFGLGAQVLADLGCRRVRLLSNSERKIVGLEGFGIDVVERVRINSGK